MVLFCLLYRKVFPFDLLVNGSAPACSNLECARPAVEYPEGDYDVKANLGHVYELWEPHIAVCGHRPRLDPVVHLPEEVSHRVTALIERCWQTETENRPSIETIELELLAIRQQVRAHWIACDMTSAGKERAVFADTIESLSLPISEANQVQQSHDADEPLNEGMDGGRELAEEVDLILDEVELPIDSDSENGHVSESSDRGDEIVESRVPEEEQYDQATLAHAEVLVDLDLTAVDLDFVPFDVRSPDELPVPDEVQDEEEEEHDEGFLVSDAPDKSNEAEQELKIREVLAELAHRNDEFRRLQHQLELEQQERRRYQKKYRSARSENKRLEREVKSCEQIRSENQRLVAQGEQDHHALVSVYEEIRHDRRRRLEEEDDDDDDDEADIDVGESVEQEEPRQLRSLVSSELQRLNASRKANEEEVCELRKRSTLLEGSLEEALSTVSDLTIQISEFEQTRIELARMHDMEITELRSECKMLGERNQEILVQNEELNEKMLKVARIKELLSEL